MMNLLIFNILYPSFYQKNCIGCTARNVCKFPRLRSEKCRLRTVNDRIKTAARRRNRNRLTAGKTTLTLKNEGSLRMKLPVILAVPGFVQSDLFVQCALFNIRQNQHPPTVQRLAVLVNSIGRRQMTMFVYVVMKGVGNLFHLIAALHLLLYEPQESRATIEQLKCRRSQ